MTSAALRDSSQARCLRVGHSIVKAGTSLDDLPARLAGADWDMVELDVLTLDGDLVVAHDPADLNHPQPIPFAAALAALRGALPADTRLDVDVKSTGYEHQVIEALRAARLTERTLVSTMELSSLKIIRAAAPELVLGLSVPKARRDYLASPLTRPAAYGMLAYLRCVLPGQTSRVLKTGQADAIMAHWGVVTPRLVQAVRRRALRLDGRRSETSARPRAPRRYRRDHQRPRALRPRRADAKRRSLTRVHHRLSSSSVTGPSLTSSTCMWAPKRPRWAPSSSQKRS
jgi:glycerophosphoryl diester phosphodiesterase